MWNFKGSLIHWKMQISFLGEYLRALRFQSSKVFLKRPRIRYQEQLLLPDCHLYLPRTVRQWDMTSPVCYIPYHVIIHCEMMRYNCLWLEANWYISRRLTGLWKYFFHFQNTIRDASLEWANEMINWPLGDVSVILIHSFSNSCPG